MLRTITALFISMLTAPLLAAETDGEVIYKQHCASCHDLNISQTPSFSNLQKLTPLSIRTSLSSGTMRQIGEMLSMTERTAVAEYITGLTIGEMVNEEVQLKYCDSNPVLASDFLQAPKWNGWGVDLENTRLQNATMAGLTSKEVSRLKLKWVFAYPNEVLALGQTNVIGGRLFVPSHSGNVYSLNAETGCAYWRFSADSSVRTAISIGKLSPGSKDEYLAYFTDSTANSYAVNAASGALVWKTKIETHPSVRVTGSPQLYKGKLYVPVSTLEAVTAANPKYQCCTHRGSVVALDAYSGKIEWQSFTITQKPERTKISNTHGTVFYGPSGAGIWSAPTIDTKLNVLYVGTGENSSEPATTTSDAILAMDLDSGKVLWSYQSTHNDAWNAACITEDRSNCPTAEGPDYDFGASPILVALNDKQRVLLAVQKSGEVHALDPDNKGKLIWKQQASPGGLQGGVMWGAATDGANIYVALSDRKGAQIKKADGSADWQLKANEGGGLVAYRLTDGKQIWRAAAPVCGNRKQCSPAQAGAVSAIPGVVFSGAYDGHIRAYSSADGKVIWDYDTVKEYDAVNGIKAQGGALDGPGPTIINGIVYVNSGYARWGGLAGNALLAFSVE
jgi:polyvinyl alcohol dehydrogenase (cytochrome)